MPVQNPAATTAPQSQSAPDGPCMNVNLFPYTAPFIMFWIPWLILRAFTVSQALCGGFALLLSFSGLCISLEHVYSQKPLKGPGLIYLVVQFSVLAIFVVSTAGGSFNFIVCILSSLIIYPTIHVGVYLALVEKMTLEDMGTFGTWTGFFTKRAPASPEAPSTTANRPTDRSLNHMERGGDSSENGSPPSSTQTSQGRNEDAALPQYGENVSNRSDSEVVSLLPTGTK